MALIAKQMKSHFEDRYQKKQYYLYFIPRRTILCEKILEASQVYDDIQIGEFLLNTIPLDDDLISMEIGFGFHEVFIQGDETSLYWTAQSLMRIQKTYFLP